MAFHNQQYADNHSVGLGGPDFNQPGKRASLLAGLRTGGPRPSSPGAAFHHEHYAHAHAHHMSAQALAEQAQLKPTAAVFTPRGGNTHAGSPPISPEHELPGMQSHGHGVPVNERLALMQQHQSQHQQIQNAQAQLAAIYGTGQGHTDFTQNHEQLMRHHHHQQQQQQQQQQRNAQQALQNQYAAQQQQMQMDMLRLQAMQQQQQQQQQVHAQQRALLARIQAEYERQAQIAALTKRQEEIQEHLRQQREQEELAQHAAFARMQEQQQHGSAREQRQAAQASIQASLRNRRDEQIHLQQQQQQHALMQQLHRMGDSASAPFEQARLMSPPPMAGNSALNQHQQAELEALMRSISLAREEDERVQKQQEALAALQMQRTQSPPSVQETNGARESHQSGNKRDRMSSHADASNSWRSSLGAMAGVAAMRKNSNTPPSIVIDDSDSDYSISRSSVDLRRGRSNLANVNTSAPDTPETSEEDLSSFPLQNGQQKVGQGKGSAGQDGGVLKMGGSSDVPAVLPSGQLNTKPTNVIRSSALAGLLGNMQRNRSDSAAGAGAASLPARPVLALNGMHTGGDGAAQQQRRVPSPPTDSLLLGGHSNGANTPASGSGSAAPRRQPKGPPTEFLAHNFASRITLRTRREAMSKLCASPRASVLSFANTGLPRATAA